VSVSFNANRGAAKKIGGQARSRSRVINAEEKQQAKKNHGATKFCG
jgi:hypothetical protein